MNRPSLRDLPAVHGVLDHPGLADSLERLGREAVRAAVRAELDALRARLQSEAGAAVDPDSLIARILIRLIEEPPSLQPVLNGTGVLLHTGLGRAPLSAEALAAVVRVASGYCSLEFDLETGERGRRCDGVERILTELTGAEAATVVNNNAAATMLALRAMASGREVIVSRGQLVEIGGSYRLPEIAEASGVRLREVGTTNRTRLADYADAIGPETAALLRVHPSNYRVVGFTESVEMDALGRLARERNLALIDDVGSGALGPGRPPLPGPEPTVAEGLAAGADVVLFSGDKLLGGPQCGIVVGRRSAVERVTRDPMMRAVRVGKMTLAALEVTLRQAGSGKGSGRIPLWGFLAVDVQALQARAEALADRLRRECGLSAEAIATTARVGGGSIPGEELPSWAVRVAVEDEEDLARRLRRGEPSVVPRLSRGGVVIGGRRWGDAGVSLAGEFLMVETGRSALVAVGLVSTSC